MKTYSTYRTIDCGSKGTMAVIELDGHEFASLWMEGCTVEQMECDMKSGGSRFYPWDGTFWSVGVPVYAQLVLPEAPVAFCGIQEGYKTTPPMALYNAMQAFGPFSSLTTTTRSKIERAGYSIPAEELAKEETAWATFNTKAA